MNFPLHFNTQLLVDEMIQRWIMISQIEDTTVLKAQYKEHIEYIEGTDLSVMPSPYKLLFDSKWKTKKMLQDYGFAINKGYLFWWHDLDWALACTDSLEFPLVLKPEFWTHGYEVRMNIDSKDELSQVFVSLSEEINYQNLVLEEQFEWQEFRITVTKNWFFWAVYRYLPFVEGDWIHTLAELVEQENKTRKENPSALCRIYIDKEAKNFLKKQGFDENSLIKKWQKVIVRSNSNVSTWWGCIDATEAVHPFFRNLAEKVLISFPGLPYIGIDILTQDISQEGEYRICELNPSPWISLHTHPEKWIKRDIPKYLIDLLFPETIKS